MAVISLQSLEYIRVDDLPIVRRNTISEINALDLQNINVREKSCLKTQLVFGMTMSVSGSALKGAAIGGCGGALVGAGVGVCAGGPPGAITGAIIGGTLGAVVGASYSVYTDYDKFCGLYRDYEGLSRIESKENEALITEINNVAKSFFETFLEDQENIVNSPELFCPVSREIYNLPFRTNCNHTFDMSSLVDLARARQRNCPTCRVEITGISFDIQKSVAVKNVIEQALNYLKRSHGNQSLILLRKQFSIREFSELNGQTLEKIREGNPLSLEESRILYYVTNQYKNQHNECVDEIRHVFDRLVSRLRTEGPPIGITRDQKIIIDNEIENWFDQVKITV